MNRKRAYLLFTLSAVLALSSCSGIKQTSGGGGTATFSATFTDTIPANTNISITNFVVTVTGFTLDPTTGSPVSLLNGPGNIPLVAPTFDLARLHADDILFGVTSVPTGTYVSITLTVSNPVITFFNQTGTTISGCANGTVCKIAVAASGSIKVSTSPFPLTLTNSQKTGVRLDFNFANALTLTAGTLGVDFTQANVLSAAVLPQGNPPAGESDVVADYVGVVTAVNQSTKTVTLSSQTLIPAQITASVTSTTVFDNFTVSA